LDGNGVTQLKDIAVAIGVLADHELV
jgi:hypothetical protein